MYSSSTGSAASAAHLVGGFTPPTSDGGSAFGRPSHRGNSCAACPTTRCSRCSTWSIREEGSPPPGTRCRPSSKRSRWAEASRESSAARTPSWAACGGLTGFSCGSGTGSFAGWRPRRRRRVRARDERAKRLQIPTVAALLARKFQAAGQLAEAFVVHQEAERLLAELAFPDVLVTVPMGPQVADGVVQVECADVAQPDRLVDRPHESVVSVPRAEVVSGGEGVARVDADPESFRVSGSLDDLRELLEPRSDHGALSRRVLEDREDVRGARVLE